MIDDMDQVTWDEYWWKDIPGYDGKYQASAEGQVRRMYKKAKPRLLTPYHKKMSGSQRLIVKLTKDGKSKEVILMQIIANTFLGPCPPGHVLHHKNGMQGDNCVWNLEYITRKELGKLTGATSRRRPVAKLDCNGNITEFYSSAREAARKNYCSYQTVMDRCNGKVKKPLGDIDFAWDDNERSMRLAIRRLELAFGEDKYPDAPKVDFEW